MQDLFNKIDTGAYFSECKQYRYALWRIWDEKLPKAMFIGLNPSTANETTDDATIKRVVAIAKHNGYGGIYMMNCWPYITTDPGLLLHNQISDDWNKNMITTTAYLCKDVVFAWGNFKIVQLLEKDKELIEMFPRAKALKINKNGSPKHPLYCLKTSVLINFNNINPYTK